MYELRRLHVQSAARVVASISVVCHLLAGVAAALLYLAIRGSLAGSFFATGMGALVLLLFWLALSLVVAAVAALLGTLVALLYNLFASWWGGLHVELGVARQTTDSRQRTADNDQPATVSKQQTSDIRQPAPSVQRPAVNIRQQETESKKEHADRRPPAPKKRTNGNAAAPAEQGGEAAPASVIPSATSSKTPEREEPSTTP